jgi:hypothetical protein
MHNLRTASRTLQIPRELFYLHMICHKYLIGIEIASQVTVRMEMDPGVVQICLMFVKKDNLLEPNKDGKSTL